MRALLLAAVPLRALPAAGRGQDVDEADAQRVERGEEPRTRDVQRVPFYEAGPAFAPSYPGFLPGLLVGSMVAGGWDDLTPSDYTGSSWTGGGSNSGGGGGGDFGGGSF